jgi:chromosome segregation ATPase
MLAVSKFIRHLKPKSSVTEGTICALKEALRRERERVEALMHEIDLLKLKLSDEVVGLKCKLAAEKQMSSVIRRSFTMRTVEESWSGRLPKLTDIELGFKQEVERTERRVMELEAELEARDRENEDLADEIESLRSSVVRARQAASALEKEQSSKELKETYRHLEAILLESRSLKAQHNEKEDCLQGIISSLTKDREALCQELGSYSELMRTERSKYKEKLNAITESNLTLSQGLDGAKSTLRKEKKVREDLSVTLYKLEDDYKQLQILHETAQGTLKGKDFNIKHLETEVTREAEEKESLRDAVKQSKTENTQLKAELRMVKTDYEAVEFNIEQLKGQITESHKDNRVLKKDIANKAEEIKGLLEELDISRETTQLLKEKMEDMRGSYARKLDEQLKVDGDKLDIDDRYGFNAKISDSKSLFEHPSLDEEIAHYEVQAQLEDNKTRPSSLFSSFGDKKLEALKAELVDKELAVETLASANEMMHMHLVEANRQLFKAMRKLTNIEMASEAEIRRYRVMISELQGQKEAPETSDLQNKVLDLQGAVQALEAEVAALKEELAASKQAGAEEMQRLTIALRSSDFKAAEARMQYYEAIKDLKNLKEKTSGENTPRGSISRLSSLFKRS